MRLQPVGVTSPAEKPRLTVAPRFDRPLGMRRQRLAAPAVEGLLAGAPGVRARPREEGGHQEDDPQQDYAHDVLGREAIHSAFPLTLVNAILWVQLRPLLLP